MRSDRIKAASFCLLLAVSATADAAIITFNGTAADGASALAVGTHSEAGYTLQISGSALFIDNDHADFPGVMGFDDDILQFNSNEAALVLTRDGGGAFNFESVQIGSLGRDVNDNGEFIFTGTFVGGETITRTYGAIGPKVSIRSFSEFTNLVTLSITTTDGEFPVMDNLTVSDVSAPVPEPASLAIWGLGALCFGAAARRRRRAMGDSSGRP